MQRLVALVLALIVGSALAWASLRPPPPAPASAPPGAFSAERAMVDDRAIAPVAHPIGSEANHKVRDYLLQRMTQLGLSPQVRRGVAAYASPRAKGVFLGGEVENILGVLPGRDRSQPAVALMAHYDSVPASSGAADDGAGVVSALEVIRALKTKGAPARDVMVLFTDGEEAGLLGADAFFNRDPAARHVGFLINMEARGDAGRVQMFQTGAGNGGAIALMRKAAPRPSSSSLTVFIYQHMPNDTDFTIARKAGIAGLNYAFSGRQFDYHSPTSIPATLDQGSLQDMGQQVLGVAQAAAFAPALPARTPDVVYSQLFGNLVLAYAPLIGWLILAVSAVLIAIAIVRARRAEPWPWTDLLRGLGACLFAVLGAAAILHFARRATGAGFGYFPQRFLLAQVTRWEIALVLIGLGFLLTAAAELARGRRQIAFLPLAAGLASSLFGGFDPFGLGLGVAAALIGVAAYGRPVSRPGAWSGVLIFGLVLGIAAQIAAPLAAFVIAWPLALAALAAVATDAGARRGPVALAVLAALAAAVLGWLGGLTHGAYTSLDLVELLALPVLLAALIVWPLAQPAEGAPPERLLGPALLILGLALTAVVRFADPYSPRYPQLAYVEYLIDQDSGHAWRYRPRGSGSPWSDAVLKSDGGRITVSNTWPLRGAEAAPARYLPAPAATIAFSRAADGDLRLHVTPPAGARTLVLNLTPNTPLALREAQGAPQDVTLAPGAPERVVWNVAPNGLDLVLRPISPGRLQVQTAVDVKSWPAGATPLPPRPANLMPFDVSDTTLVLKSARFAW